ncbi:hypothetical protein [Methylobacterium sp. CM6244]
MTSRIRIQAVATDEMRLIVMEAHGAGDAATLTHFSAALAIIGERPGDRGAPILPPPVPAIAPPKKPRRRRP